MLLIMGLAGVAGTWCVGRLLHTRLFSILIIIPLVMAGLAIGLIAFGAMPYRRRCCSSAGGSSAPPRLWAGEHG